MQIQPTTLSMSKFHMFLVQFQLNSFGLAVMRGSQVKLGEAGATLAGRGPLSVS